MVHGGRLLLIVGSLNTGCNYIYSYSVDNFLYFVKGWRGIKGPRHGSGRSAGS